MDGDSALVPTAGRVPALAMNEDELIRVLESSIYPGAQRESIKLVIGYCKASNLDPLQKPVHIVPMSVKKAGTKNEYEWRDVIMPGISLYRTQAARSGCYAGISEPEFGPLVSVPGAGDLKVPEWCRVTARRFNPQTGLIFDFTAVEYWFENYATAGKDSTAPNAMWRRRNRGQIAKCTEAQALRKAFPEIGNAPIAEEMDGKTLGEDSDFSVTPVPPTTPKKLARKSDAERVPQTVDAEPERVEREERKPAPAAAAAAAEPGPDGEKIELASANELAFLSRKAESLGVIWHSIANERGMNPASLTKADFNAIKSHLMTL